MGDAMIILEFQNRRDAEECMKAINSLAAIWWRERGYTVQNRPDGDVLIGQDNEGKDIAGAVTTTWDIITKSGDDTFYFSSLSNDPRFPDWKSTLADFGFSAIGNEIEFPDHWKAEASFH